MQCYCKVRNKEILNCAGILFPDALFTDAFGKQPDLIYPEVGRRTGREGEIFFAGGLFADLTVKMKMPVFMGMFIAAIIAQLIPGSVILLYTMNNTFILKSF